MVENDNITTLTQADLIKNTIAALQAQGLVSTPRVKRRNISWERKLVYEYVESHFTDLPHWYKIELGPIPEGQNQFLYSRTRRWCDAVIRAEDKMIVIEGKMRAKPDAAAQLEHYGMLLPETPLFKKYSNLPRELQIVTAMVDPGVPEFMKKRGIKTIEFKPSNYDDWYKYAIQKVPLAEL